MTPSPATLPVATRAWCIRDSSSGHADTVPKKQWRIEPSLRPVSFIAINTACITPTMASMHGFDSEGWTWERQALLFGCAVIGHTHNWRIKREVIFYPDNLPDSGLAVLRSYINARTYCHGAQPVNVDDPEPYLTWRTERRVIVQFLPLSDFLKLFYRIAYEDRALVIGYDLPYHLSRLAADWRAVKKGDNVGGWRLILWTFRDHETGEERPSAGWRPSIILKQAAPNVTFIEFTGRRADKNGMRGSRYRGEFLDVSNLAHALTGRHRTLGEACAAFTGEALEKCAEPGQLTPNCIDAHRTELRATVSLAGVLLELFDRLHPVSRGSGGRLLETRLYSPGGLARAYLRSAGYKMTGVPQDRIGAAVSAFYGGWAEVQLRGKAPIVQVDFRRQYQTVFVLQGLQDLLAAEQLAFVDDTAAIRSFVDSLALDDLVLPETWPKLSVLCWIKPAGEILPVRAAFSNGTGTDRFTMAMTERHSDKPVVAFLADVIAAKLLSGRAPEIVRAERIAPEGQQQLRKARLFGGARFDPGKDQLFKLLVEEGERFNRGDKRYANIPAPVRAAILPGVKAIGNIGCFGTLIETRGVDLLPGRREEVSLLTDGEPVRTALAHPEDPGPIACPPLAGLVTAGGRLLLAMVHRFVADRGGIVAACDTDGGHIVATPEGGTTYSETRGADYHEGGPAQPIRALSFAEVAEIAACFEPLNLFNRALLPGSPLQVKAAGNGHFISPKRYAITAPDGSFIDYKESILGMLSPPWDGWIEEAWRALWDIWDGRPPVRRPWFDLPALRRLAVTSPAYARELKGLSSSRPWNHFFAALAIGRKPDEVHPRREVVIAPSDPDPEKWAALPWHLAGTGDRVQFGKPDGEGVTWRLRTIGDFLTSYARHSIPEMLAPDGSRCGAFTRGVLRRRPLRDGERWLLLKEAAVYGDDPNSAFSMPQPEMIRQAAPEGCNGALWESAIKPALAVIGPDTVARSMGLSARTGRSWVAGERRPEKPAAVAKATVGIAHQAGLREPCDENLRAEEICSLLPARVLSIQSDLRLMLVRLADRLGGIRALARALAEDEPTVRRWFALAAGEVPPIRKLNSIIGQLSKYSRAEIRRMRRRIVSEHGPAGDRAIVTAYLSLLYNPACPGLNMREECV
jgi:hypothetical protein